MRTLVISDLHLGARNDVDVLRRPAAQQALLGALDGVDRLVVLGDLLELRHGPMHEALEAARPVLKAIGETLGPDGEVVLVPGNHDFRLISPWLDVALAQRARAARAAGARRAQGVDRHARDRPDGCSPRRSTSSIRASGSTTASTRPTATTSIAT